MDTDPSGRSTAEDQPPRATPGRRRGRPGYDVDSLLEKAVEVFTAKGFDGTSMEDLSQRLGISKSAIYHHVSSKDQLLELAIGRALDGLSEAVAENRLLAQPAIDRIEHLIRRGVTVLLTRQPFVTLLLSVRGNTDVERRALERRRTFDRYVAELVAEAIEEGSVRADTDPQIAARLMFGMVNSLTEWVRPTAQADAERLADAIVAITFDGLRSRPG